MAVGIIFLCASPLFWVLYPDPDVGGPAATVVFATLGVLFIALDVLM